MKNINHHPVSWNRVYPRSIKTVRGFSLLEADDKILIGLSGGADSLVLLDILFHLQNRIDNNHRFTIIPGHIQGMVNGAPIADIGKLKGLCSRYGLGLECSSKILGEEVFADCFKCSIARRRSLFDLAESLDCTKIALGHNADDLIETALLNMFYQGRFSSMHPRQRVLKGRLAIIRPLAFTWKRDIAAYAREKYGPVRKAACAGGRDSNRLKVHRLLAAQERRNPGIKNNILAAIANPKPEYLPIPLKL